MYRCRSAVMPGTVRRQHVHPRAGHGAEVAATPSVLYTWRCRAKKVIASTIASTTPSHALIDTHNVSYVDQDRGYTVVRLLILDFTPPFHFMSPLELPMAELYPDKAPAEIMEQGTGFWCKNKTKNVSIELAYLMVPRASTYVSGSGYLYLRRARANKKPPTARGDGRELSIQSEREYFMLSHT